MEVLLGRDDRHLDLRVTVAVELEAGGGADLVVTTAVLLHNAWGGATWRLSSRSTGTSSPH